MAKIKLRRRTGEQHRRKTFHIQVDVDRDMRFGPGASPDWAYGACVRVSSSKSKPWMARGGKSVFSPQGSFACDHGASPRRALAKALRKLSSTIVKRSSSFKGWRRKQYKKRRR